MPKNSNSKTLYIFATVFALVAFAGNSVLCRLALQEQSIDATSFTILRLLSGAITLYGIVWLSHSPKKSQQVQPSVIVSSKNTWLSALMLFSYAASFSYAYILFDAGIGALILFGCVQLTMISISIFHKHPLSALKWCGLILAFSGLIFLVFAQGDLPHATISLWGVVLMAVSGVAWALYTVLGKGSTAPLLDTSTNFKKSLVFTLPLLPIYYFYDLQISNYGLILSIMSGALTSGLGYAIWYYALNGLSAVQAGVVQLLVPVIAAIGGLLWIGEAITIELVIAQLLVLSGIALVMFSPKTSLQKKVR